MFDKIFKNSFLPMYYLNTIFFIRKFRLQDSVILASTKLDNVLTFFINIAIAVLYCFTMREFTYLFDSIFITGLYYLAYTQYLLNFWALSFITIKKSEVTVKLMKNLQDLNRFLHKKDSFIQYHLLLPCVTYLVIYAFLVLVKLSVDPLWSTSRCIFITITITFDLEIVYAAFKAYYVANKLEIWTCIIKDGEDFEEKKMFMMFEKILDTVTMLKNSYQLMVLSHFITNFFQSLMFIEILILWTNSNTKSSHQSSVVILSHIAGVTLWVSKGLLVGTALCSCFDQLYRRSSAAEQEVCALLWRRKDCKTIQRFAKNVLRASSAKSTPLCALGLFNVDAALPLRFAAAVATYTVVLLQFAFL